ncbi:uncharacterized protein L969DRAFT_96440 [Mixia osmundae IAM 14324]|uniref:uncharacterized protein n=1 Tax=Mixia osmundae (strain CBS 9802 / IAM 14324 / JCM 22182 / KY 12970) TaxID=764103 RepID=UPI0004A54818|nr:uncharacterized protein L969DRAFT_96440 [Mixia osmundae IAM 14324]KEI37361.1 hypothetical protein L969DRAFT_96440 [Mixia osmundae IAM 14324]
MAHFLPCVPKPNHLVLIDACYPAGKALASSGPDYAPDSNSVSKLVYYCSMKPHKSNKVAKVLLTRAQKDALNPTPTKGKPNLCITLAILTKLLDGCRQHLSYFAREAIEIIELAAAVKQPGQPEYRDNEVAERAASAFHAFATFADSASLGIDNEVTRRYLYVLAQFGTIAREPYGRDKSMAATGRLIGLHVIDGAVVSDIMYTSEFSDQVKHIMPALLFNAADPNISLDFLEAEAAKTDAELNFNEHHTIRRPLADRKLLSISVSGKGEDEKSEEKVAASAVFTLRSIFRLSHNSQLGFALDSFVDWADSFDGGRTWQRTDWLCWLAQSMVQWTHLQYRFVIINTLLEKLLAMNGVRNGVTNKQVSLLAMVQSVLLGPTSMVGLGIGDILAQLVSLIIARARVGPKDALLPYATSTIAALGTHVYYADQYNDLAQDIFEAVATIRESEDTGDEGALSPQQRDEATRSIIEALAKLLQQGARSSRMVQVPVPLKRHEQIMADASNDKRSEAQEAAKAAGSEDQKDATGRTVLKMQATVNRNPIRPEVWQDGLAVMGSTDPTVRLAFGHANLAWIRTELFADTKGLDTGSSDASASLERFFNAYSAQVFELLTSRSIAAERNASGPNSRKRQDSSIRRSPSLPLLSDAVLATPADFSVIKAQIEHLFAQKSIQSLLAGVPMLLALDEEAGTAWASNVGDGGRLGEPQRRRGCREIAAAGVIAAGHAWQSRSVLSAASEAQKYLSPSTLPTLPSLDAVSAPPPTFLRQGGDQAETGFPVLNRNTIIDGFASDNSVQSASGLSATVLRETLNQRWSTELAIQRAFAGTSGRQIRENSPAQSIKLVASSKKPPTARSPSISDMRNALGSSEGPAAAPTVSRRSSGYGSRRISSVPTAEQLNRLGLNEAPVTSNGSADTSSKSVARRLIRKAQIQAKATDSGLTAMVLFSLFAVLLASQLVAGLNVDLKNVDAGRLVTSKYEKAIAKAARLASNKPGYDKDLISADKLDASVYQAYLDYAQRTGMLGVRRVKATGSPHFNDLELVAVNGSTSSVKVPASPGLLKSWKAAWPAFSTTLNEVVPFAQQIEVLNASKNVKLASKTKVTAAKASPIVQTNANKCHVQCPSGFTTVLNDNRGAYCTSTFTGIYHGRHYTKYPIQCFYWKMSYGGQNTYTITKAGTAKAYACPDATCVVGGKSNFPDFPFAAAKTPQAVAAQVAASIFSK